MFVWNEKIYHKVLITKHGRAKTLTVHYFGPELVPQPVP